MAGQIMMRQFARWHIWLGWLIGFPILMWTATGLLMVIKPIEEVRGEHLRKDVPEQALPSDTNISVALPETAAGEDAAPVRSVSTAMRGREPVTTITYMDGSSERFRPDGTRLGPISEVEARLIVAERIIGGDAIVASTAFDAGEVPFDFRRPEAVWQVALSDGTHVYVSQATGDIAAVRTRWWRAFDFAWGLHIMDLQTREDTSHPILIVFAVLGVIGSLIGCILLFRRRKARVAT